MARAGSLKVALVGAPNVGKSAVFNRLTGSYAVVSNYPGTTVEVFRGRGRFAGRTYDIMDTPGMYSLQPLTEEEAVTRRLLFSERPDLVVHVVDAKNLERMLPLTLALVEAGFRVVVALNMLDEAAALGLTIDTERLSTALGVPVVEMVATSGRGVEALWASLSVPLDAGRLPAGEGESSGSGAALSEAALFEAAVEFSRQARALSGRVLGRTAPTGNLGRRLSEVVHGLTLNPVTGIPLLLAVVYFGLYRFIGTFGAGTVVDALDRAYQSFVSPWVSQVVTTYIPWETVQKLLVHDYGVLTLGLRYALIIILPIVTTYFVVFSVIEDCGYLPRLALLVDGLFKKIGLNGRAVIPMALGFGCVTMATVATRTLETRRERIITTFLMALAIPCSAQLGVVLALLSGTPVGLVIWAGFVGLLFLVVGWLTARLVPGEEPSFYMELPPLRLPRPGNVALKTYSRVARYVVEIVPLFALISVVIWVGDITGALDRLVSLVEPIMKSLGLPGQAARAFVFGFVRRDYGAAGLYDLEQAGLLTAAQLVVGAVTLTLFVPCVAQFTIMAKERGLKAAALMATVIALIAYSAGWLLNSMLSQWGVLL